VEAHEENPGQLLIQMFPENEVMVQVLFQYWEKKLRRNL
jgi:hypothetical protein